MSKQITSKLAEVLKMMAAVFLVSLLSVIYPAAISHVKAQTVKKQTASARGGGQKEGLKVHGHWTIDVRNPDGTLVTHREFENALTNFGGYLLALFLARDSTPGPWNVQLIGNVCQASHPNFGTNCVIGEGISRSADFLTLSLIINGPNPASLTFAGAATAQQDGTITGVGTFSEGQCANNVTPYDCTHSTQQLYNGNYAPFTSTSLLDPSGNPAPLSVTSGQIIQVKVVISFS